MTDKDYTVAQVVPKDDWTGAYGPMKSYALKLEGVEEWVQVNQKPETPAPTEGGTLFGHLESKVVGDKTFFNFKKANKNFAGGGGGGASSEDTKYIIQMLEELTGRRDKEPTDKQMDEVEQMKDGEDFDLSAIPF